MTAKYEVLTLLWSPSQNRYIQPGEVVILDDGMARLLMEKQCVKPAEFRRKRIIYEVKNGTND